MLNWVIAHVISILQAETRSNMNWVLFKTKKPKNGQLVYTYNLDKDIFNIGYYDNKYKCTIDYDDFMIDATHWSLPQTPKDVNYER